LPGRSDRGGGIAMVTFDSSAQPEHKWQHRDETE
jgi:hypothetical protein